MSIRGRQLSAHKEFHWMGTPKDEKSIIVCRGMRCAPKSSHSAGKYHHSGLRRHQWNDNGRYLTEGAAATHIPLPWLNSPKSIQHYYDDFWAMQSEPISPVMIFTRVFHYDYYYYHHHYHHHHLEIRMDFLNGGADDEGSMTSNRISSGGTNTFEFIHSHCFFIWNVYGRAISSYLYIYSKKFLWCLLGLRT